MPFPEILIKHEVLHSLMTGEFVYPVTVVYVTTRYANFHCTC